jgi:lipoyl(octanoyl) transferase
LIKAIASRDSDFMAKLAATMANPALQKHPAPEWRVAQKPVSYLEAIEVMEQRVADIEAGTAPELIWLVEHPPLYTAGTSAAESELLDAQFPVFKTGRGGRFTYHGPGQRVIYCVMDLRRRGRDVRAHVCRLEEWIIRVLADFGIKGERREGRIGIWITCAEDLNPPPAKTKDLLRKSKFLQPPPQGGRNDAKIAAIGVRVRRWIAYHGLSFNVNPDLSHYRGIVPCGLTDFGVTSLKKLGVEATMEDIDQKFRKHLVDIFGE